jgi:hypothetical protein
VNEPTPDVLIKYQVSTVAYFVSLTYCNIKPYIMKNPSLPIAALFIITGLLSCKKTDQGMVSTKTGTTSNFNGVVPIQGKWSVKSDSVISGVGAFVTGKNYVGKAGDYFDFDTYNKLYVKEGSILDTFSYTLLTDSTLDIIPSGAPTSVIPFWGGIRPTSASSVTVIWGPSLISPGAYYSRIVSLKK